MAMRPYAATNQTTSTQPHFSAANDGINRSQQPYAQNTSTENHSSSYSGANMSNSAPYYNQNNSVSNTGGLYQPTTNGDRPDSYSQSRSSQPSLNSYSQYDVHRTAGPSHTRTNDSAFTPQLTHSYISQQYGAVGGGAHDFHTQSSYANNTSYLSLSQYNYQQPRREQYTARASTIDQPYATVASASHSAGRSGSPLVRSLEPRRPSSPQPAYESQISQSSAAVHSTVDPSKVYDPYHEYQRRARQSEAEETRHAHTPSPPPADSTLANTTAVGVEEPAKSNDGEETKASKASKTSKESKSPRPRKPRAKKSQASNLTGSTAIPDSDEPAQAAALTLMQTANSGIMDASQLEAQMKAMFQQMRKFNQANPDMLARLWQQERNEFVESEKSKPVATSDAVPRPASERAEAQTSLQQSKVKANMAVKYGEKARPPRTSTLETNQSQSEAAKTITLPQASTTQPQALASGTTQPKHSTAPPSSSSPSIPQQASTQRSMTIWPADKKAVLAAAAVRILSASNPQIVITTSQVSSMLDTNPTYIQLYDKFLALGFQLDRSAFAKALLNAVPEINRAPRPTAPVGPDATSTNSQAAVTTSTSSIEARAGPVTQAVLVEAEKRMASGETLVATPMPSVPSPPPRKRGRPQKEKASAKNPDSITSQIADLAAPNPVLEGLDAVKRFLDGTSVPPKQPERPAGVAVVKSRKVVRKPRPFVPPAPPMKKDLARKQTFLDLVDLTQRSDSDDDSLAILPSNYEPDQRTESDAESQTQMRSPRPASTLQAVAKDLGNLIENTQPMELNETTSLSSITHGTSSEPADSKPLSAQRAHVGLPVSAAQPSKLARTAPSMPSLPPDHPARSVELVKPWDKYNAIRRSGYNAKTIARDVLLAAGRHPDMRELNAHLEILKLALPGIDNNADLSTFRWDVVDPGGPEPGSGSTVGTSSKIGPITVDDDADDEGDELDHIIDQGRHAVRQVIGPNGLGHSPAVILPTPPVKRKRNTLGRPPRQATASTPGANSIPSNPAGSGTPSGYAALWAAQTQAAGASGSDGQPVKKRGRPVGWRKWMQKGSTTPAPSTGTPKPQPPPVDYKVFRCDWLDCGTELHNLATLRKHIHKLHIHRDADAVFPCQWHDCAQVRTTTDNDRTTIRLVPRRYTTEVECRAHIENAHLKPIAWSLGDGPAEGVSDPDASAASDAYLSDARGRRVTPRIEISDERARTAADPRVAADVGRRRARLTGDEAADEARAGEERRRRAIGPGIDRGGARLANEKRRAGFVDDDDEVLVVDDDDDVYA